MIGALLGEDPQPPRLVLLIGRAFGPCCVCWFDPSDWPSCQANSALKLGRALELGVAFAQQRPKPQHTKEVIG